MSAARLSFLLRQQVVAVGTCSFSRTFGPLSRSLLSSSFPASSARCCPPVRPVRTAVSAAIPATPSTDSHVADSYEFVAPPAASSSSSVAVLVTCEHASNAFPAGLPLPAADRQLADQHWAADIGAEQLARELSERLSAPVLLSRVSRLVVDVNRPLNSDTLMRNTADGRPIALNAAISPHQFEDRVSRYYLPYHLVMKQAVKRYRPHLVLAVHSFAAQYEGQRRDVELGVLYKRQQDEPYARDLCRLMRQAGIRAELNEPWSGLEGFMYAVDSLTHTHAHQAQTAGGLPAVDEQRAEAEAEAEAEEEQLSTAHGGHPQKLHSPLVPDKRTGSPRQRHAAERQSAVAVQYPVATLMLEARQDLIVQKWWRQQVMDVLQQFIESKQTATQS